MPKAITLKSKLKARRVGMRLPDPLWKKVEETLVQAQKAEPMRNYTLTDHMVELVICGLTHWHEHAKYQQDPSTI